MPRHVAVQVVLSDEEREVLERWARRPQERPVSRPALPGRSCLRRRGHQRRGGRAPWHHRHNCAQVAGKICQAPLGRPAR
jgi:hypothetical protein